MEALLLVLAEGVFRSVLSEREGYRHEVVWLISMEGEGNGSRRGVYE